MKGVGYEWIKWADYQDRPYAYNQTLEFILRLGTSKSSVRLCSPTDTTHCDLKNYSLLTNGLGARTNLLSYYLTLFFISVTTSTMKKRRSDSPADSLKTRRTSSKHSRAGCFTCK